jgi:hypothetical protein
VATVELALGVALAQGFFIGHPPLALVWAIPVKTYGRIAVVAQDTKSSRKSLVLQPGGDIRSPAIF